MAPPTIPLPTTSPILLHPAPLTPSSFSRFGTAILPPLPSDQTTPPVSEAGLPPVPRGQPDPVIANQGSAVKFSSISAYSDNYAAAPSAKKNVSSSKPAMTMFSCFPRRNLGIRPASSTADGNGASSQQLRTFPVRILERHPFTTQTFIPLNTTNAHGTEAKYLVVVAPSLSQSVTGSTSSTSQPVSITNPPDLSQIHAFIATPGMAVTYGAGTWHAPMVVLGDERIDFVVVQWVSGVPDEDCQEVCFGEGIDVVVGEVGGSGTGNVQPGGLGLWTRKAKL